jgi:AmmeMemoRadiSam system protein A
MSALDVTDGAPLDAVDSATNQGAALDGLPVDAADGAELARYAVAAVRARLSGAGPDRSVPASPALRALGGTFVTLTSGGRLRGCIGSIDPARPRYLDVRRNATRAMRDPRLPPVTAAEWPTLDIEVSVLNTPQPLTVAGPHELLAALRPGVDGLLLTDGARRATFLPSVWEKLPDPARFLSGLLRKGGWPQWAPGLVVERYTAAKFADHSPRAPLPFAGSAAGRAGAG